MNPGLLDHWRTLHQLGQLYIYIYIYIYIHTHTHTKCSILHYYFHRGSLFQVLSTVQQTRISWVLSVRKAALWHNSLLQIFGNAKLYFWACMPEAPIERFHSVWETMQRIWKESTNDYCHGVCHWEERGKINFPYHSMFELTGPKDWPLKEE